MGGNLITMERSLYKWRRVKGFKGGHRIFVDENTGRMAVADDSGRVPDQTEDGVLWLPDRPGLVHIVSSGSRLAATFPVVKEGDDNVYSTIGTLEEGLWVAEERGWRIMLADVEVQRVARRQEDRADGA